MFQCRCFKYLFYEGLAMKRFLTIASRVIPMLAVAFIYVAAHPTVSASACQQFGNGEFEGGCQACGCFDYSSGYSSCDPSPACGRPCLLPPEQDCDDN